MMHFVKLSWLFTFFAAVSGCATRSEPSYRVEFDHDVSIILENDQVKEVKRGEPVDIPAAPITVTRSGHKTVVLLPIPSKVGILQVRLPKEVQKNESEDFARTDFGQEANRVAQAIIEIQNLLVEKRADEALVKIQIVRDRLPGFSYLRFLEASCFVVKNDLTKAKVLAEQALLEFPNDEVGWEFMTQVGMKNIDEASPTQSPEENQ